MKVVSERLGHSSASMTLDVYSHVTPDMPEQAAQKFAKPYRNKAWSKCSQSI
ncbi:integrase [Parageobacillus genomosp. 1]|uniref:Integrase n=1 Tax=Parageobacillus genomosp. 1 TaxID=1295642 RepID=A0ABC9VEC6_9BACL|nr:integrase [Parageobacillus genomosp. 1]